MRADGRTLAPDSRSFGFAIPVVSLPPATGAHDLTTGSFACDPRYSRPSRGRYHDIGLFVPNMGWHYMKDELVDGRFEPTRPELLVYADDPCGGKRRLVAVEYAVPFAESRRAPAGFVGRADEWDANQDFGLWTLHAWLFEFNQNGVFNPFNPRVD
jgi:hypothetical protein